MIAEATENNNAITHKETQVTHSPAKGVLHFAKFEMIQDLRVKFPELSSYSEEEAEEHLIYGMKISLFTEKGKIKEGVAFTVDEASVVFLRPKAKNKKDQEIKLNLLKITDISRGKLTGNFVRPSTPLINLEKVREDCCLTIHYDNNFKFYNFIFPNELQLHLLVLGLIRFLEKTIEETKTCDTDLLSLKRIWKEYDPNHNKYLNVDQFSKFLKNINFQWKKKKYDQIFKEIDVKKEGKIRFKDFISFYELIVTGEEFREVFQKYSSDPNKKYLSMRGLADFMEKEQHVRLSSQEILNLMTKFSKKTAKLTEMMKNKNNLEGDVEGRAESNLINLEVNPDMDNIALENHIESMLNIYNNHSFGRHYIDQDIEMSNNYKNAFSLTFREFVNMLIDKSFNNVYNSEYFAIHQNMNLPLYNYFIYSSHNTYLDGNQINSKSTLEMYYCAIKNGCRLVELDCWDGRSGATDEPIITHWHFPVGELNFREVLVNLRDYSFNKSEYPVLLSVENHCSPKTQLKMEKYFREVLGEDNLYILDPENPPINYPSPNDLKRKFIVKCKRKRIFGSFDNAGNKKSSSEGKERKHTNGEGESVSQGNQSNQGGVLYGSQGGNQITTLNNANQGMLFNNPSNSSNILANELEENPNLNKKANFANFIGPDEVIQEEECNNSNDNFSDIDENAVNNSLPLPKDYNFKKYIDNQNMRIDNPELSDTNQITDQQNEANPNQSSSPIEDKKFPSPTANNNNNNIQSFNKQGSKGIILINEDSDKLVNVNVNLNVNTYNITNNYFLPEARGSLKNLTNTGNLACPIPKKSQSQTLGDNFLPIIRNKSDFSELVRFKMEDDKEIKFKNLRLNEVDMVDMNEGIKDEYKGNDKLYEENPQTNKHSIGVQLNSQKKTRKKSFTSHESVEAMDKNELQAVNVTTSNQLLKKLKIKYSVEPNEEEGVNNQCENGSNHANYQAEIIRIQEIKQLDEVKLNKVPMKTIDQLATVVGMVGVKYKREDFDNSHYLPWECISISEPDFEKYIRDPGLKLKIIKFCQRGFLKIYPDIMRTNSSNHDPVQCWAAGVQIAALNLQKTDDDAVLINKIFFKINGGSKSGYILKPDILLNPQCDEAIRKMFWKPIFKIKLKVLSGFHLHLCFPKVGKISGIFVEVSLKCPRNPLDEQTQEVVLTTDTISNNFLHPVWQSNSKQFEIYDPDLSFFMVKIYSVKKQNLLARSIIPVKILNLGYRVLDLYDNMCSKFDDSFLIIKTNKIFLN